MIEPLRLPDHLGLAARAVSAGLFDGLHLDVEPHALPAWHDPRSRAPLLRGTVELFDLVRSALSDADMDAAINPDFAAEPYRGETFSGRSRAPFDLNLHHVLSGRRFKGNFTSNAINSSDLAAPP